jgi:hypothetical protein
MDAPVLAASAIYPDFRETNRRSTMLLALPLFPGIARRAIFKVSITAGPKGSSD